MGRILLILFLVSVHVAASHTQSPRAGATTVSGHVYCADTNSPARMATVVLQPAKAIDGFKPGDSIATTSSGVQTLLDGSFVLSNVAPGTYYVVANLPGYLSPLSSLMSVPADATQAHEIKPDGAAPTIPASVPKVTVQANQPASVNISLERGASVSGAVLFDDGSPASGLSVAVYVPRKDTWVPLPSTPFENVNHSATTDDQGHYRISGLPPGEYIVEVELALTRSTFHSDGYGGSGQSASLIFSLPVYSGNKVRPRDAARFSLKPGEERRGEDIDIPISKLHTVRGSILARRDGHVINGGDIELLYADDRSSAVHAELGKDDDGVFQLSFVAEGDYILKVGFAADYEYVEVPNAPQVSPPTYTDRRTLRSYGGADLPVHVEGEIWGLTISVPDAQPVAGRP
jgi:Carboxypeptidase regulatory-like domain